jgi:HD-GYP domain-containing protein (c-di-GMP phosphodiesterase class II)/DNA-binding CsgD family transcriptional regulator
VLEPGVRLAELLGALSLACDVADGFPPEKVMRSVVLAVELGRRRGLSGEPLRDVFYATLFRYLGCTAFSHEEAHTYGAGDDIQTRRTMALADAAHPLETLGRIVRGIGAGAAPLARARAVAAVLGDRAVIARHAHSQCETSIRLATLVGASENVRAALEQICERWDGRGEPRHASGEALSLNMRISHLADVAEIEHHRHGRAAARALVQRRQGGQLDPSLCELFLRDADALFDAIEKESAWDAFLASEPKPHATATPDRLDDVALAFAYFADLKSAWLLGHSTGTATLAVRAAESLGLPERERAVLRRAAWLHDIGRVSAPNRVWDKPGKLTHSEWERVRQHAYYTERILSRAPALRDEARVAAAAHERLDGGGYHRAIPGQLLDRAARLLAAADVFQALGEARPHRPAFPPDEAARLLAAEAEAGRLDRKAVRAVLAAAGRPAGETRAAWPCQLTDREVEVLRLVARGKSNKEIGVALDISARTVQHHVIHIYEKIGTSSRAAAALFATEHALL